MYDLDSTEERSGTSLSNKYEAKLAVQLYSTLDRVSDGLLVKTRVAIITPYSQQSSLLHRLFEEKYGPTYIHRVEIRYVVIYSIYSLSGHVVFHLFFVLCFIICTVLSMHSREGKPMLLYIPVFVLLVNVMVGVVLGF